MSEKYYCAFIFQQQMIGTFCHLLKTSCDSMALKFARQLPLEANCSLLLPHAREAGVIRPWQQLQLLIITPDQHAIRYDPDSNRWSPVSWTNNLSFALDAPLVVKNKISTEKWMGLLLNCGLQTARRPQNAQDSTARKMNGKISPLNEARRMAFDVSKSEKIFIAGGVNSGKLRTYVVYNIPTGPNRWVAVHG